MTKVQNKYSFKISFQWHILLNNDLSFMIFWIANNIHLNNNKKKKDNISTDK